jgi:ATP-dependent Clp protease protease subunit
MEVLVNDELVLYGAVGESFWEDGFTARDVMSALPKLGGKDVNVRINSGGGDAFEGVAIYNALKLYAGKVTVFVDSVAASAASIIAMAGNEIVMRKGAVMMIHDPAAMAMGNAQDMQKAVEMLNTVGDAMASIYAAKTGEGADKMRADMKEEIWLTSDEAVARKYADRSDDADAIEASAFDYRAYSHAPQQIVALSDQKAWSHRLKRPAAKAPTPSEKPKMTDNNTVDTAAIIKAEQDRSSAIIKLCADANVSFLAASMVKDGTTVEAATARIKAEASRITAIKAKFETAKGMCPQLDAALVDQFIAAGTSAEAAGDELLTRVAAVANVNTQTTTHGAQPQTDQVVATAAWDKIVAAGNARRGFAN